ncbi:MAG: SDR family oxidoreductase [Candidatus Rokubacteria bacterium]|nr:SDR family oxidoreductase [Candidatus Rokubacteria bacterium]
MASRLRDKVALITGSGAGIGRAAALRFAAEGARVVVAEVVVERGEAVAEEIAGQGGEAVFVKTEVADPASVRDAIRRVVETFGRLNILYNNAGGSRPEDGLVTEVTEETWWKTHSVDLFGTFVVCKYGIPELIRAGGGVVVNTASYMALVGNPLMAYSAAKGGVISLTRCIAAEYGHLGIRANVICPCAVLTERLSQRLQTDPRIQALPAQHLLGLAEPADIAGLALFLASDEARRITGAVIAIDSGLTAR